MESSFVVDSLFVIAPIVCVFFCVWSLFCYTILIVLSSSAIISLRKPELVALLKSFSCCHLAVLWLFITVGWSAVCYSGISWSFSLTICKMS